MLVETASLSGVILLILGAATAMAWALTQSGFSQQLATAMTGLPGGKFTFMAASIVAFVVLGSVLEGIPVIVLFGPLLFPIAEKLGIHEVHYAMVTVLAMGSEKTVAASTKEMPCLLKLIVAFRRSHVNIFVYIHNFGQSGPGHL